MLPIFINKNRERNTFYILLNKHMNASTTYPYEGISIFFQRSYSLGVTSTKIQKNMSWMTSDVGKTIPTYEIQYFIYMMSRSQTTVTQSNNNAVDWETLAHRKINLHVNSRKKNIVALMNEWCGTCNQNVSNWKYLIIPPS